MRSNPLLKWLLIPLALLLVYLGIRTVSGRKPTKGNAQPVAEQATPAEMKELGIIGDTPRDTIATLVAQVKQLRTELQSALTDNKHQKADNDRLRARESAIDQRVQSALDSEHDRLQHDRDAIASDRQQTQSLLQQMQARLDQLKGKSGQADLPVGLGLENGDGEAFQAAHGDSVRWIEPLDTPPSEKKDGASSALHHFATSFAPAQKHLASAADRVSDAGSRAVGASLKPVYTVPANSTLMDAVAMTALIGRVPIDGTVNDPYPFKVLIGADNLTANGITIPDIAGAVVSGTASGDWTLSCVRGQIRSITFVFQDGTIRTLPQDSHAGQNAGERQSTLGSGASGGLGWISDPYGVPCVSGVRRSNAEQYLGTQALITAAGAGAAAFIQSGSSGSAIVASSNGSLGTVGISGNEAMGRILAGGVRDMADWVNKLYGQAFAAIVVKPGAKVAVHLEQPLTIDYDAQGRRVDDRLGDTAHARPLD